MGLSRDNNLFTQVFGMEPTSDIKLPQHLTIEKIVNALTKAAQDCFAMQIDFKPLSPEEWKQILDGVGNRN